MASVCGDIGELVPFIFYMHTRKSPDITVLQKYFKHIRKKGQLTGFLWVLLAVEQPLKMYSWPLISHAHILWSL